MHRKQSMIHTVTYNGIILSDVGFEHTKCVSIDNQLKTTSFVLQAVGHIACSLAQPMTGVMQWQWHSTVLIAAVGSVRHAGVDVLQQNVWFTGCFTSFSYPSFSPTTSIPSLLVVSSKNSEFKFRKSVMFCLKASTPPAVLLNSCWLSVHAAVISEQQDSIIQSKYTQTFLQYRQLIRQPIRRHGNTS